MLTINPKEISTAKLHAYLLGAVAPRPIAFASTIDEQGNPNLSPFSFFNVFGSNPPTLIFSPARRVRDNTIKHTLENAINTKEVVINVVSYDMVQQMSLSSVEFPKGVNEFIKSGFTPLPSERVKPFRVKESPVQFECVVKEVKPLGNEGGAGNLIICEVLMFHIHENILNEAGHIDPHKIDLVARMGNDFYCRASGDAVFEVAKPNTKPAIGYDAIPEYIRNSEILSANNLGQLGNIEQLPDAAAIEEIRNHEDVRDILLRMQNDTESLYYHLFLLAKDLLSRNQVEQAWCVLLLAQHDVR
jgi:flavin reductase (DIM6/NTAB) family NADH-FMN oxidoreductase RutF